MTDKANGKHRGFSQYSTQWTQENSIFTINSMCLINSDIRSQMICILSTIAMVLQNFYAVGIGLFKLMFIGVNLSCYWISDRLREAGTAVQEWSYVVPAAGNAQNSDNVQLGQRLVTVELEIGRILKPDVCNDGAHDAVLQLGVQRQAVERTIHTHNVTHGHNELIINIDNTLFSL